MSAVPAGEYRYPVQTISEQIREKAVNGELRCSLPDCRRPSAWYFDTWTGIDPVCAEHTEASGRLGFRLLNHSAARWELYVGRDGEACLDCKSETDLVRLECDDESLFNLGASLCWHCMEERAMRIGLVPVWAQHA